VIASAWLRLRPLPRSVRCFEATSQEIDAACSKALGAARLASSRTAALVASSNGGAEYRIVVELAGDRAAVEQDSAWWAAECDAEECSPQAVDSVRELLGTLGDPGGLRFRISALPSRHATLVAELRDAGASVLCYPGLRLVYAGFALPADPAPASIDARFTDVETAARATGGSILCEAAPAIAKTAGRDMHGDVSAWLPLFTGLKRRFDPGGILNPGRFAGGL
jgi:glycolate oxidase FAD binding subunit